MSEAVRHVVVQTTIDSEEGADMIAERVIDSRLAACVQVMPIRSIYRWKGKVERAAEFLLAMKAPAALAAELSRFVRSLHPYETPELVVLPLLGGDSGYLAWIDAETSLKGSGSDDE
jgi:periplasmic divalent cation tolerance protein